MRITNTSEAAAVEVAVLHSAPACSIKNIIKAVAAGRSCAAFCTMAGIMVVGMKEDERN